MESGTNHTNEELYRLVKDNNHMLHSMRRNAFWGGVLKFTFYIFIFVVAPLWIYTTYVAPVVQGVTNTMGQVQGTNASAQAQFKNFQDLLKQFESKLPAFMRPN